MPEKRCRDGKRKQSDDDPIDEIKDHVRLLDPLEERDDKDDAKKHLLPNRKRGERRMAGSHKELRRSRDEECMEREHCKQYQSQAFADGL